jgi:glycosyltransferase involved in cell wall biosynthesis
MSAPTVSVVMSAYNEERYLGSAMESLLDQTFDDFEVIVVDDGSKDRTPEILASYDDPRVRVVRQENRGLIASLNRGVDLAQGRYIARMDGDDIAYPERLARQVAFLDAHPDVGLLGTAFDEIDGDGRVIGCRRYPTEDADLRRILIRYNPFFHSSVMMRRELLQRVGGYIEAPDLVLVEDYDLWFRLARVTRLAGLPDVLVARRYHGGNLSVVRETLQLRRAVLLRWRALRAGQYPPRCAVHLVRPALVSAVPASLRIALRRYLLGSRIYSSPPVVRVPGGTPQARKSGM